MTIIFLVFILVGLIILQHHTEMPLLSAAIYAGARLFFGFLMEVPIVYLLVMTSISFVLASIYFWLLARTQTASAMWWAILVAGCLIVLL